MIAYELWETRSGNLMATYGTVEQAFEAVARTAAKYGTESIISFALLQDEDDNEPETIAVGQEIVALAERYARAHPGSSGMARHAG